MAIHRIDQLTTRRLTADRVRPDHLDVLCALYEDPRVTATLGGIRPRHVTREMLERRLAHWEQHGFGDWVFRDRATGRLVGRGGLRRLTIGGVEETEVVYAVASDLWGRGFATEMAEASVEVALGTLGLPGVVAFTLPTNAASRRVMEKVGFTYERDFVHAELPHVLYRLTARAWRRA